MEHLTREQIYHLAELVTQDLAYTGSDGENMRHIGECDACFRKLRIAMALMDAVDHMDIVSLAPRTAAAPEKSTVRAVIRLIAGKVDALLQQLDVANSSWTFSAPLSLAAARGAGDPGTAHTLEDEEDSQTFLAYDPAAGMLAIQLVWTDAASIPRVLIRRMDGSTQRVSFSRREHLLWAEITDLADGEYEIILEK